MFDILEMTWFWVSGSQVRVRVRVKATTIRRGYELYECLLVNVVVVVIIIIITIISSISSNNNRSLMSIDNTVINDHSSSALL